MYVLDRQVLDRGGPSHVRTFLHTVLFPSIRLLVVHPQETVTTSGRDMGSVCEICPYHETGRLSWLTGDEGLPQMSDETTVAPLGKVWARLLSEKPAASLSKT